MKFGNPVDTGLPEVILAWSYWLPTTFKMADWRRFALSFSLWVCSNLRTEFLVEDFFEGNFAHLFEVFLHHAADAGYKHTHTHTHTGCYDRWVVNNWSRSDAWQTTRTPHRHSAYSDVTQRANIRRDIKYTVWIPRCRKPRYFATAVKLEYRYNKNA